MKGELGDIVVGIMVLCLFGVLILGAGGLRSVGATDGEHTGIITAVEYESNVVWGNYLIYFKTDPESTQEDVYCINENLVSQAKELAKTRDRITISFRNSYLMWAWQCNNGQSIVNNLGGE